MLPRRLLTLSLAALMVLGAAAPARPKVAGEGAPGRGELEALLSGAVRTASTRMPREGAAAFAAVVRPQQSEARLSIGRNVNVVRRSDPVETRSTSCNQGKQTAQNEHSLSVNPGNPKNLVGGSNDYRLYSNRNKRYDGSGAYYTSFNGGKSWKVGLLPGLIRSNTRAPGPYDAAGDPAIAAGPKNVFWYANIAFNRDQQRGGVAVSRSTNGGKTWKTSWVIRGSWPTFHDKEWIAADPIDPRTAYVTWTLFDFERSRADIMLSKTTNGGSRWSAPVRVSTSSVNQGSVPMVDDRGNLHVVYAASGNNIAHAFSPDGGATFVERRLEKVEGGGIVGVKFRTPFYLPGFAIDGPNLHIVFASSNGVDADILYLRSPNYGLTWLPAVSLSGPERDQFFPWVGARDGKVYASWFERVGSRMKLRYMAAASPDNGTSWTSAAQVSSVVFDAARGNKIGPDCGYFIGDYTALTVGSDGVAHVLWPDARKGNSPGDPGTTADLDPYTATVKLIG